MSSRGLLTAERVGVLMQERLRERASGEPLAAYAARRGALTVDEQRALVLHQRAVGPRLGAYFVEAGLLAARELRVLALAARRHNARWPAPGSPGIG